MRVRNKKKSPLIALHKNILYILGFFYINIALLLFLGHALQFTKLLYFGAIIYTYSLVLYVFFGLFFFYIGDLKRTQNKNIAPIYFGNSNLIHHNKFIAKKKYLDEYREKNKYKYLEILLVLLPTFILFLPIYSIIGLYIILILLYRYSIRILFPPDMIFIKCHPQFVTKYKGKLFFY